MKTGKLINVISTSIYISFILFRMYIFKSHFKLTVSTIKETETRIGIETLFYYYSIHAPYICQLYNSEIDYENVPSTLLAESIPDYICPRCLSFVILHRALLEKENL